jgi:hypothetical protein
MNYKKNSISPDRADILLKSRRGKEIKAKAGGFDFLSLNVCFKNTILFLKIDGESK